MDCRFWQLMAIVGALKETPLLQMWVMVSWAQDSSPNCCWNFSFTFYLPVVSAGNFVFLKISTHHHSVSIKMELGSTVLLYYVFMSGWWFYTLASSQAHLWFRIMRDLCEHWRKDVFIKSPVFYHFWPKLSFAQTFCFSTLTSTFLWVHLWIQ